MKGKFQNWMAEFLYGEWMEGRYDDECHFEGGSYVVFINPDWGHGYILSEDEQGFVDLTDYTDDHIQQAWQGYLEAEAYCNDPDFGFVPYIPTGIAF